MVPTCTCGVIELAATGGECVCVLESPAVKHGDNDMSKYLRELDWRVWFKDREILMGERTQPSLSTGDLRGKTSDGLT